jgi:hypothetical protein
MTYPTFTNGTVLPASDLNAIGLWLVKSQTVASGVSSVVINSAFSSDYDSYRIVVNGGTMSSLSAIGLFLNGTSNSYYGALMYTNSTGAYSSLVSNNSASCTYAGVGSTNYIAINIDIHDPFKAAPTRFAGQYCSQTDFGTNNYFHNIATSYTGFTLSAGANFTGGTVYVYGYRKA